VVGTTPPGNGRVAGWARTAPVPTVNGVTTTAPAGTTTAATDRTAASVFRQVGIDSAYLLLGFPLGVFAFVVAVVGTSVSAGLLVTVAGIPIFVATLYAARLLADLERWRMRPVLRRPGVRPIYRRAPEGSGRWRRLLTPIADPQSWLDYLHLLFRFPMAIAGFVVTVTWWSVALGGLFYAAYQWAIPRGPNDQELHEVLGLADTTANRLAVHTGIGVLAAVTLPFVIRAFAVMEAGLGHALLNGVAQLRQRVAILEEDTRTARAQTTAAVSAEATALRRLERDIHDGPQQRLVRLAMDLSRAQQQMDTDPTAARATVAEAIGQTRATLDELRALSRGIAPPILTDRGLRAAITTLASRSIVPVELDIDPALDPALDPPLDPTGDPTDDGRLSPTVEGAAYFVVAEALTNVAKHSQADECRVVLRREPTEILVSVYDDGTGGASTAKGHGLAGLADRVHAAGGAMHVTSPPGGPTTVAAVLPCR
jgi:signal transduction histidine kinase